LLSSLAASASASTFIFAFALAPLALIFILIFIVASVQKASQIDLSESNATENGPVAGNSRRAGTLGGHCSRHAPIGAKSGSIFVPHPALPAVDLKNGCFHQRR